MKIQHLLLEMTQANVPEDGCDLCQAHEFFQRCHCAFLVCPNCEKPLDPIDPKPGTLTPVGSENVLNPDDEIHAWEITHCRDCDMTFASVPTQIIWNANHDVYYTGGKSFLTQDIVLDESGILSAITQYHDRIQQGDMTLQPWNLLVWITYALETAVATYLVEQGMKLP
jgi:hypothetical protein